MFGFSAIAELAFAEASRASAQPWTPIDDGQVSSWGPINDTQTSSWTPVSDSQASSWVDIPLL